MLLLYRLSIIMNIKREIKLNKTELAAAVAANANISKASAGRAVDATLEAIFKCLGQRRLCRAGRLWHFQDFSSCSP